VTGERTHGDLGASRIVVVTEPFFPLRSTYLELLAARGYAVKPVRATDYCPDRNAALRAAAAASCDAFLLAYAAGACPADRAAQPDVPVLVHYDAVCPDSWDDATGRRRTVRWVGDLELPIAR
jgi:hypothetical protein